MRHSDKVVIASAMYVCEDKQLKGCKIKILPVVLPCSSTSDNFLPHLLSFTCSIQQCVAIGHVKK